MAQVSVQPTSRDYAIEIVFMGLAMLPVIVSAYVSIVTGDGQWFQRSGSLMVLFSVAVEYHRSMVARRAGIMDGTVEAEWGPSPRRHILDWRSIPYICYAAILMGTLIWAYGDLLFVSMETA
ncbi:hypothetical protein [Aquisalimonas sp.]|uniref:hypothetical protein n=1 Tax=Aquisalimonas sp. TaxID=1872621 RepID=UPI0025C4300E|nr:hypothetical protein [Aquisalimonas sp.]